ncbi:MAG: thiolase family protein [candidate division Zixibacteria bacterium]|nr:thiolase family protein [candidate division Zixibacteria bacterium]
MTPVYLIDGCRSPIGRGHPEKGMYRNLRADDLAVQTLKALLNRLSIRPSEIDDFFLGCVGQHLEQGKNLARLIILLAGLPQSIPGVTINRLCASSLTALQLAADSIRAGTNKLALVGGVEHLGHVPMTAALDYNPELFATAEFQWSNMGLTAEKLATTYGITREAQDEFALESNRRYFAALGNGRFRKEIVNIQLSDGATVDKDEEPRQSTKDSLAGLRTPFKDNGTVTAANSSGVSDGACMAAVGDQETITRLNLKPLAEIRECVTIGLDPTVMGLGPVYAIPKLLGKAGLKMSEIDSFEINEAFAVQVLACQRELKIPSDRLNIHGGAVALGHPLGMSGLRIAVSLAHTLASEKKRYGVASMCVGHGQGVAMLLERV